MKRSTQTQAMEMAAAVREAVRPDREKLRRYGPMSVSIALHYFEAGCHAAYEKIRSRYVDENGFEPTCGLPIFRDGYQAALEHARAEQPQGEVCECGHVHVHPESCEYWIADMEMCICKRFTPRENANELADEEAGNHMLEWVLVCLKDSHVQNNKHRLGVLGKDSIDSAVEDIEQYLTQERPQKLLIINRRSGEEK